MKSGSVLIVGAGIGGLSAALALQRRGFKVAVYERAQEICEIGAGVNIAPNGRRVLRDLQIDAALEAISSCVPIIYSRHYATGAVLQRRMGEDLVAKHGMSILQVHRADLHNLLMQAVIGNDRQALHPGHDFVHLEQDPDGVTASFANGVCASADALIGADGNASSVRSIMFPGEAPRFTGQVAFRALIPEALTPTIIRERGMVMYPGPQRMLLHYPLRGGRLMNLIAIARSPVWEEEGWAIPATNGEFADAYHDFASVILELIWSIPLGGLFKWGLRDREPLAQWTKGRVTMLGDAAHPMTPFLGQGACMAMEDALLLARAFVAADSPEEAFRRYEAARRTRGSNVQLWSRDEAHNLQNSKLSINVVDRGIVDYDAVSEPV